VKMRSLFRQGCRFKTIELLFEECTIMSSPSSTENIDYDSDLRASFNEFETIDITTKPNLKLLVDCSLNLEGHRSCAIWGLPQDASLARVFSP